MSAEELGALLEKASVVASTPPPCTPRSLNESAHTHTNEAAVRVRMSRSRLDSCHSPAGSTVLLPLSLRAHSPSGLGTIATAGDVLPLSPPHACRTFASFASISSRPTARYNFRLRELHQRPNYLGISSKTMNLQQDAHLEGDNLRGRIFRAQAKIRTADKRAHNKRINVFDSPNLLRDSCLVKLGL